MADLRKVLISDKLAPEGVAILEQAAGIEVEHLPGLKPEELAARVAGCHGLLVRSGTRVTRELLEAADSLEVVGRAGIGVDNVDVEAASKRGIVVMNTPTGNNVTTAEHTISMLLAAARHIARADASLRAGQWRRSDFIGTEVCNKTLGIIGTGNVGAIVADRARGLKMKVIAYDPYITEEAAERAGIEPVPLAELYARSDFISVHTPLTPETEGMVGREAIEQMKPGVRVINCARGGIIDEQALATAIAEGKVAAAAIDVFTDEPPAADHPLLGLDEVVVTPHLGASTDEAQLNVAVAVAEQMRDFLLHGVITNAVNVPSLPPETAEALLPYLSLGSRIGSMHAQLAGRIPNEVTIEFQGEVAEADSRPVTAAVLEGLLGAVMESPVNTVNAPLLARERGVKVAEVRTLEASGFASAIQITFTARGRSNIIAGAVFGGRVARLVRFDDFYLECVPEGIILVLHNRDVPGVVGRVGTFLGDEGVNIAGLALGGDGEQAVSFVHVDKALSHEQLEALRALKDITGADMVELD